MATLPAMWVWFKICILLTLSRAVGAVIAADGAVLESLEWDTDASPRWRGVSLQHIPYIAHTPLTARSPTSRTLTAPLVAGASYIVELDLTIQNNNNNTAPLRVSLHAVTATPTNSEYLLAAAQLVRGNFGSATPHETTTARILITIPEDRPKAPSRSVFTVPFQNANTNLQRLRVTVESVDYAMNLVRVRLCEPSTPAIMPSGRRSHAAFLSDTTELARFRAGGYDTAVIPATAAGEQIAQSLQREGIAYLPMIDLAASFATLEEMLAPGAQDAVLACVEQVAMQTRRQQSDRALCVGVAVRLPASSYANQCADDVLQAFYSRMADRVAAHNPNSRLYIFGDAMLSSEASRQFFAPTLPRRATVQTAMRRLGWDARQPLDSRVIMPRTALITPLASLDISSLGRELDSDPTNETTFAESVASLFVYTQNQEEIIVMGDAATARWAYHLAVADVHNIFEVGNTLPPLPTDNAAAFIREFRRIPNVPFQKLATPTPQPLTVRVADVDGLKWVYCVNASSVPIVADITLSLPAGTTPNIEGRLTLLPSPPATHSWQLPLPPYSLRVACLGSRAVVHQAAVERSARESSEREGDAALAVLKDRVALLTALVREAKRGVRYDVTAAEPFSLPATGRLFVLAQVGVSENQITAPVRFVLFGSDASGTTSGKTFQRAVDVSPQPGTEQVIDGIRWGRVVVPFLDIPTAGTARLAIEPPRVGQIWVDDLTTYSVAFTASEIHELTRRAAVAAQRLDDCKWTSLELSLDGYWMAYLTEHIPRKTASPITVAPTETATPTTTPTIWSRARNLMPW